MKQTANVMKKGSKKHSFVVQIRVRVFESVASEFANDNEVFLSLRLRKSNIKWRKIQIAPLRCSLFSWDFILRVLCHGYHLLLSRCVVWEYSTKKSIQLIHIRARLKSYLRYAVNAPLQGAWVHVLSFTASVIQRRVSDRLFFVKFRRRFYPPFSVPPLQLGKGCRYGARCEEQ